MSSKKCPSCGLTNFGSAVSCKRCQQSLQKVQALSATQPAADSKKQDAQVTSSDSSEGQPQYKRIGQIVGGALIALGLIFGVAIALTQDYYYLAIAGPALLIGAFVVVLTSREINRVPTTMVWLRAFHVGIIFTVLGVMFLYTDGLFTIKSFVPLFGVSLLVIGRVAYRRAKLAEAAS